MLSVSPIIIILIACMVTIGTIGSGQWTQSPMGCSATVLYLNITTNVTYTLFNCTLPVPTTKVLRAFSATGGSGIRVEVSGGNVLPLCVFGTSSGTWTNITVVITGVQSVESALTLSSHMFNIYGLVVRNVTLQVAGWGNVLMSLMSGVSLVQITSSFQIVGLDVSLEGINASGGGVSTILWLSCPTSKDVRLQLTNAVVALTGTATEGASVVKLSASIIGMHFTVDNVHVNIVNASYRSAILYVASPSGLKLNCRDVNVSLQSSSLIVHDEVDRTAKESHVGAALLYGGVFENMTFRATGVHVRALAITGRTGAVGQDSTSSAILVIVYFGYEATNVTVAISSSTLNGTFLVGSLPTLGPTQLGATLSICAAFFGPTPIANSRVSLSNITAWCLQRGVTPGVDQSGGLANFMSTLASFGANVSRSVINVETSALHAMHTFATVPVSPGFVFFFSISAVTFGALGYPPDLMPTDVRHVYRQGYATAGLYLGGPPSLLGGAVLSLDGVALYVEEGLPLTCTVADAIVILPFIVYNLSVHIVNVRVLQSANAITTPHRWPLSVVSSPLPQSNGSFSSLNASSIKVHRVVGVDALVHQMYGSWQFTGNCTMWFDGISTISPRTTMLLPEPLTAAIGARAPHSITSDASVLWTVRNCTLRSFEALFETSGTVVWSNFDAHSSRPRVVIGCNVWALGRTLRSGMEVGVLFEQLVQFVEGVAVDTATGQSVVCNPPTATASLSTTIACTSRDHGAPTISPSSSVVQPTDMVSVPLTKAAVRVGGAVYVAALALSVAPAGGAPARGAGPAVQSAFAMIALSAKCTHHQSLNSMDSIALQATTVCNVVDHPLQFLILIVDASLEIQCAAGTVIGNTLLIGFLGLAQHAVAVSYARFAAQTSTAWYYSLVTFLQQLTSKLPGALVFSHAMLLQPTMAAAVALIEHGSAAMLLGLVGFATSCGPCLWFAWVVVIRVWGKFPVPFIVHKRKRRENANVSLMHGIARWLTTASGAWQALSDGSPSESSVRMLEHYGPVFLAYRGGYRGYFIVEGSIAAAGGVVIGIAAAADDACAAVPWCGWCLASLAMMEILCCAVLRPFAVRLDALSVVLIAALVGASELLTTFSSSEDISSILALSASVVQLVTSVLGIALPESRRRHVLASRVRLPSPVLSRDLAAPAVAIPDRRGRIEPPLQPLGRSSPRRKRSPTTIRRESALLCLLEVICNRQ